MPRGNKTARKPSFRVKTHINFWSEKFNGRDPSRVPGAFIYLFIYAFEICTLLRNYAARNVHSLSTFQDNLSGPIGCPETSAKNYYYSPRNFPEECRSHLLRGGSLKSWIVWLVCPNNKSEEPERRILNLILSILPEVAWKLLTETTRNLIQDSRIQAVFQGGTFSKRCKYRVTDGSRTVKKKVLGRVST